MRRPQLLLLILLSLLMSCGRRTPPEPYPTQKRSTSSNIKAEIHYRGETLRLLWTQPESLEELPPSATGWFYLRHDVRVACGQCGNPKSGAFWMRVGGKQAVWREDFEEQIPMGSSLILPIKNLGNSSLIEFTPDVLQRIGWSDGSIFIFTLDQDPKEQPETSLALRPQRLRPIPEPKILRCIAVERNDESGKLVPMVQMHWKPVFEAIQSRVDRKESFYTINRNYELRIYQLSGLAREEALLEEIRSGGLEELLLPEPMENLRFLHVDRFGNESNGVTCPIF